MFADSRDSRVEAEGNPEQTNDQEDMKQERMRRTIRCVNL